MPLDVGQVGPGLAHTAPSPPIPTQPSSLGITLTNTTAPLGLLGAPQWGWDETWPSGQVWVVQGGQPRGDHVAESARAPG